jgi:hypothetical protein
MATWDVDDLDEFFAGLGSFPTGLGLCMLSPFISSQPAYFRTLNEEMKDALGLHCKPLCRCGNQAIVNVIELFMASPNLTMYVPALYLRNQPSLRAHVSSVFAWLSVGWNLSP